MQRRTRLDNIWRCLVVSAAMVLAAQAAHARKAEITLSIVGDQRMAAELQGLIDALDKDTPLSGDALSLLQGAQARRARLETALRSRGFYDAEVHTTYSGRTIDEPEALDAIAVAPASETINFAVLIQTGSRYRVATLAIRPAGQATTSLAIDLDQLSLKVGSPADAAEILKTEQQILEQLRERGHALAAARPREVVIDYAVKEAYVTYVIEEGPLASMGPVRFSGTQEIDTKYLQRRVPFSQGEPYRPGRVNELRDRMTSLGVFNSVRVTPASQLEADGRLPIDVELRDRAQRSVGFGVAYETQLGFSVNAYWLHRNLFGQAESLRLATEMNRIGQGAFFQDSGYAFKADFRKPDWWLPQQDAVAQAQVVREVFDAYRRKAVVGSFGFERTFSPHWRAKVSLAGDYSEIEAHGTTRTFALVGLPMSVTLDRANSAVEPTKGYRFTLAAAPYMDAKNQNDVFSILRLTGAGYLDISGNGRSVLAGRASYGMIPGASTSLTPPDKLFYAGGGGSVRGFAYQSAGPRDAFNTPIGGASVVEGSLEFRQRIGQSFGAVAFVDAGSAYLDVWPDFASLPPRVGAGVGLRYYTGFGPARLDVAVPLNRRSGDAPFGIYVSLGQAF
ncbi:MAG: outer membrane protein assembly factor [Enhydrobacter sp.]|nr:MAG: outer membrane protein assembly factor [Enhydrobacter sp.]